jgi:hypothetical protein
MLQRRYRTKEAQALAQLQKLLRNISQVADTHQSRLATILQGNTILPTTPNRGVVTIFTAATDMIKSLYCHNNMLQELHDLPHPEPEHGATAAFDCHLGELSALVRHSTGQLTYFAPAQCSLADSQWGNDNVDERQQHSVGPWNLPLTAFPDCPTSLNGVAMSGNRSFRH